MFSVAVTATMTMTVIMTMTMTMTMTMPMTMTVTVTLTMIMTIGRLRLAQGDIRGCFVYGSGRQGDALCTAASRKGRVAVWHLDCGWKGGFPAC